MPAVVFGPDRVIRRERSRVGLVLGAGGVLGAAWMTGALTCLQERFPAADADLRIFCRQEVTNRRIDLDKWLGVGGLLMSSLLILSLVVR